MENEDNTKITFKLTSPTSVEVLMNNKHVGQFWAQSGRGTKPYPHDNTEYCKSSVQMCGFDRISEVWSCGTHSGKKDCVVQFNDESIDYYKSQEPQFESYVKEFMQAKLPMAKLKTFHDWVAHMGHPSVNQLIREMREKEKKE